MTAQHCASAIGHWQPRGTVFVFQGRTEYIEKYGRIAQNVGSVRLERCGDRLAAWRYSERPEHDPMQGYVDHFAQYQQDIDALIDYAKSIDLPKPLEHGGHSMGGCIDCVPCIAVAMNLITSHLCPNVGN